MCLSTKGRRLLTGSLDHRVKVIDMVSYKVVHTMTYTSPILSIATSVSSVVNCIFFMLINDKGLKLNFFSSER